MVSFYKNFDCPPSPALLKYQSGKLSKSAAAPISRHIETCEFCEAEVGFYKNYPQTKEKVRTEEIPPPLYELAEAILGNKGFTLLDTLAARNDRLRVNKA